MNKSDLRKVYLEKRLRFSAHEVEKRTEEIEKLFFQSFDLSPIRFLHIFLPMQGKNEMNTWTIVESLQRFYPATHVVLSKSNFSDFSMKHYLFDRQTILHNQYGIPEPEGGIEIRPEQLDMVLVPLLAFDLQGNRIGYGKGFYDRFLSQCKKDCIKIGLSLEEPVLEKIETSEYDVSLDHCITFEKIYSF